MKHVLTRMRRDQKGFPRVDARGRQTRTQRRAQGDWDTHGSDRNKKDEAKQTPATSIEGLSRPAKERGAVVRHGLDGRVSRAYVKRK